MEITSLYFVGSAVVALFIFYILHPKYRVLFLVVLSLGFIASYSYNLLFYVLVFSSVNYYIGLRIAESRSGPLLFKSGLIINLLQLILLKYVTFSINPILHLLNLDLNLERISEIIVPVGISFFTLQGIGYLINLKMRWEKPEKNYLQFLLYIVFFPKFLSGPIERSNHFLPQLKTNKLFDKGQIISGLRIILFGVFKKVAIANQLAPFINGAYTNLDSFSSNSLLLIVLLQPLYLYFDFSGYTDIAIGTSRLFGIKLLPNFNSPFLSRNVTTLWKRMHMSLSLWFNDYVFRQLSFRYRKWGIYSSVFAVFVTFGLFGIWHGAGWNFMILGLLQAFAINFEFFTKKIRIMVFEKMPDFFRVWLGRIFTYLFFALSHIFFFSPDLETTSNFFSKLTGVTGPLILKGINREVFFLVSFFITIFLLLEVMKSDFISIYDRMKKWHLNLAIRYQFIRWVFYFTILTLIIVFGNKVQQFIYFQF